MHDAEYFRRRRAEKRAKAIADGTFGLGTSGRYSKPSMGRSTAEGSFDEFPAAVFERGRQLSAMMRTPLCMWPADWLSDE